MSIVTLQLGQCGNQIGGQFFSTLVSDWSAQPTNHTTRSSRLTQNTSDYAAETVERFFSTSDGGVEGSRSEGGRGGKMVARAVLVDTEQKAIVQTMQEAERSGSWRYPAEPQICERRGSGNNWARGFCGHGPDIEAQVMGAVRRQAELCDRLGGFLNVMSLAGGTGSGVGAYVTQCVRDEFPHAFIVNQVVWPYSSGEVAVQSYNAVLSLAHLYQSTDAIVALENDTLQRICSQLFAIPKVTLRDVNRVIALKLASVLTPAYPTLTPPAHDASTSRNHLGDLLEHLVPHPEYKMLSLRSIPLISDRSVKFTTYNWPGLVKHLRQMLIANASMEEGIDWQIKMTSSDINRSVANALLLRGVDSPTADVSSFRDPSLYASWQASPALAVWSQPRPLLQYERTATLLSNDSAAVRCMDATVERAWQMYAARAYVHQYARSGLDDESFMDCFAALEQVIASYRTL